jgi:putative PIN family toxin of toxin-antitoxin system
MPPTAVVDASVLVSAFLFPASVPGEVLSEAERNSFTMHLSTVLIEETRRSLCDVRLRTAHGHTEDAVRDWCDRLRRLGTVFAGPLPMIGAVCRDPDDDHVIATVADVQANAIVTGDKDLLSLRHYRGIRMITAGSFLAELAAA